MTFEPDDSEDPQNWSTQKKRLAVALASLCAFSGAFGSALYVSNSHLRSSACYDNWGAGDQAPGEPELREKYGVSADVSSLGLALYVLGFGLGPLYCASSQSNWYALQLI